MSDDVLVILTLGTALGCGLAAGVFFAFSAFIMTALGRLPAGSGIAAMQSINVFAVTPLLMTALFGTALACLVLIVATFVQAPPASAYLLTGAALYLTGTILVTIVFNVPRNNALAAASPTSAEAAPLWADYLIIWTRWNHVRTPASLAASAQLMLALLR